MVSPVTINLIIGLLLILFNKDLAAGYLLCNVIYYYLDKIINKEAGK